MQALDGQGRRAEAATLRHELNESWPGADAALLAMK
jgi:hypothetical protein